MTRDDIGDQHQAAKDGTDPRGWLVFRDLPEDLQNAEDATRAADHERTAGRHPLVLVSWTQTRPATPAERALLAHLGHVLPDELTTNYRLITDGVVRRWWPQLETEETHA